MIFADEMSTDVQHRYHPVEQLQWRQHKAQLTPSFVDLHIIWIKLDGTGKRNAIASFSASAVSKSGCESSHSLRRERRGSSLLPKEQRAAVVPRDIGLIDALRVVTFTEIQVRPRKPPAARRTTRTRSRPSRRSKAAWAGSLPCRLRR